VLYLLRSGNDSLGAKEAIVMRREMIIRIVCDVLIAVLLFGFILSLLWYLNGSLEMCPTEEQEDKAKIGALFSMIVFGIPCFVCVAVRAKHRKR